MKQLLKSPCIFSLVVILLVNAACSRGPARVYVMDDSNVLAQSEKERVEGMIKTIEEKYGAQMSVKILPTLAGIPIEEFSDNIFGQLSLGRDDYQDGILITMVTNDHQMRLEVGKGLVNILPDETCRRINDDLMIPHFKEGQFYKGLEEGIEKIASVLEENKDKIVEYKEDAAAN